MTEKAKKSIIQIHDNKNVFLGLGFVIASNEEGTYIVTASHVIKNDHLAEANKKLKIEGSDEVKILCQGNIFLNDIAVIYIVGLSYYIPLKLYTKKNLLPIETTCTLLGYSELSSQNAFIITKVKSKIGEHICKILQDNQKIIIYEIETEFINEIDKGYSGTAVFMEDTDIVIGILSSKKKNSKQAYVIPIQQLKEVWNNKKNWEDESKWREIPSIWFDNETLWNKIKNNKVQSLTVSIPIPLYQVQKSQLKKIKSLFIVLGIIGILFLLSYEKFDFFLSEKLIVCYEERDFNIFPPQYIGCQQVNKDCFFNRNFGKYKNQNNSNLAYQRCIESTPRKDVQLYRDFAKAYIKNKKYDYAIKSYKKALDLNKEILRNIFPDLRKVYKKSLIENPSNSQYYSDLGWYYFKMGEDNESLNWSNIAIKKSEKNENIQAYSYYNIGRVYERQQNCYEALQNYESAFKRREDEKYRVRIQSMEEKLKEKKCQKN